MDFFVVALYQCWTPVLIPERFKVQIDLFQVRIHGQSLLKKYYCDLIVKCAISLETVEIHIDYNVEIPHK